MIDSGITHKLKASSLFCLVALHALLFPASKKATPPDSQPSREMSSSSAAALLYAASVAVPSVAGARPDDELTKTKAHHVKGGGFNNTWPSWQMHSTWAIIKALGSRRWN